MVRSPPAHRTLTNCSQNSTMMFNHGAISSSWDECTQSSSRLDDDPPVNSSHSSHVESNSDSDTAMMTPAGSPVEPENMPSGGTSLPTRSTPRVNDPFEKKDKSDDSVSDVAIHHKAPIKGVNPNQKDRYGDPPLSIAIRGGKFSVAQLLLANGADPNQKDRYGDPPLNITIHKGDYKTAELLLIKGADPNTKDRYGDPPLCIALHGEHLEIARLLLMSGVDPNKKDRFGNPPLSIALSKDLSDIVEALTTQGWT